MSNHHTKEKSHTLDPAFDKAIRKEKFYKNLQKHGLNMGVKD